MEGGERTFVKQSAHAQCPQAKEMRWPAFISTLQMGQETERSESSSDSRALIMQDAPDEDFPKPLLLPLLPTPTPRPLSTSSVLLVRLRGLLAAPSAPAAVVSRSSKLIATLPNAAPRERALRSGGVSAVRSTTSSALAGDLLLPHCLFRRALPWQRRPSMHEPSSSELVRSIDSMLSLSSPACTLFQHGLSQNDGREPRLRSRQEHDDEA